MKKINEYLGKNLNNETRIHLANIKSFIDWTIKDVIVKKWDKEEDKHYYLIDSLVELRDYIISQASEDSLKIAMKKKFADELLEPKDAIPSEEEIDSEEETEEE